MRLINNNRRCNSSVDWVNRQHNWINIRFAIPLPRATNWCDQWDTPMSYTCGVSDNLVSAFPTWSLVILTLIIILGVMISFITGASFGITVNWDLEFYQSIFHSNLHSFSKTLNPNFVRFWNSYYFSRILRQFCYNLMMKNFQTQNRTFRSDIIHWQLNVEKLSRWLDDFPPILWIWRKIIKQ